jgi:hypothetical protein
MTASFSTHPLEEANATTATAAEVSCLSHPSVRAQDESFCSSGGCMAAYLSDELWMQVLNFLPPLDLIRHVARVSQPLAELLQSRSFWSFHTQCLLPHWSTERELNLLNTHQLQRVCIFVSGTQNTDCEDRSCSKTRQFREKFPRALHHGSLLVSREVAEAIRKLNFAQEQQGKYQPVHARRVCLATSTEHASEMLENVLASKQDYELEVQSHMDYDVVSAPVAFSRARNMRWWSSQPTDTKDTNETLLFVTNCPLAMLHSLSIKALLDPFTRDRIYGWYAYQICAYRLPMEKIDPHPYDRGAGFPCSIMACPRGQSMTDRSDVIDSQRERAMLDKVLQGEMPVYQSLCRLARATAGGSHENSQIWVEAFPPGVMANCVTITLYGKKHRQFDTSTEYYTCVERFSLKGIPLPHHARQPLVR